LTSPPRPQNVCTDPQNALFKVQFRHNQLEKTQFRQITELQINKIEGLTVEDREMFLT